MSELRDEWVRKAEEDAAVAERAVRIMTRWRARLRAALGLAE